MPLMVNDPRTWGRTYEVEPGDVEQSLRDGLHFYPQNTYTLHHLEHRLRVNGVSYNKARDAILDYGWSFGTCDELLHTISAWQMPIMPRRGGDPLTLAQLRKDKHFPTATRCGVNPATMSVLMHSPCGELSELCNTHEAVYSLLHQGWDFDVPQVYVHHPRALVHCNRYGKKKARSAILEFGWRWGASEKATRKIAAKEVKAFLDAAS